MDASVNRIPSSRDERAFLIAVYLRGDDRNACDLSLDELQLLVETAGAITVGRRTVNRIAIDPSTIIGKGFIEELRAIIEESSVRLVVFDMNNIRPAQVRNLEDALKCRVVGRTEIILDIFARRARSSEAKIQVELAQLRYILPRLKGLGGVLSRLGGGIGTRGPGEKMLETDRRHVMRRIDALSGRLEKVRRHRETARKRRTSRCLGAVVGYTNAGKSTLINLLAHDDLFVEDRLFATLDSYTRSVFLTQGETVLLTDTVGFIRNLPANLVDSFRSTLEEIRTADFLVHVVDGTSPDMKGAMDTVSAELTALDAAHKPTIRFFNKCDAFTDESTQNLISGLYPDAVVGSAKTGDGIEMLKMRIVEIKQNIGK